jgi:hypothetical protein
MSKAKTRTTPADDWRQHQLRRRAAGKGKHPLPHGRYSGTKKTLHDGVQPRHRLLPGYRACDTLTFLSPAQIEALEELCVLSAHTWGFSFSPAMDRVCKAIADEVGPADRDAYLARASKRERLEIFA